jgi:hypothetical protein
MKVRSYIKFGGYLVLTWLSLSIISVAAWITHVVFCIEHDRWGFLIAGAIMFPIGIVHGILIWLGLV